MRLRAPDHGRALRAMQEAVDRELAAARTGGGRASFGVDATRVARGPGGFLYRVDPPPEATLVEDAPALADGRRAGDRRPARLGRRRELPGRGGRGSRAAGARRPADRGQPRPAARAAAAAGRAGGRAAAPADVPVRPGRARARHARRPAERRAGRGGELGRGVAVRRPDRRPAAQRAAAALGADPHPARYGCQRPGRTTAGPAADARRPGPLRGPDRPPSWTVRSGRCATGWPAPAGCGPGRCSGSGRWRPARSATGGARSWNRPRSSPTCAPAWTHGWPTSTGPRAGCGTTSWTGSRGRPRRDAADLDSELERTVGARRGRRDRGLDPDTLVVRRHELRSRSRDARRDAERIASELAAGERPVPAVEDVVGPGGGPADKRRRLAAARRELIAASGNVEPALRSRLRLAAATTRGAYLRGLPLAEVDVLVLAGGALAPEAYYLAGLSTRSVDLGRRLGPPPGLPAGAPPRAAHRAPAPAPLRSRPQPGPAPGRPARRRHPLTGMASEPQPGPPGRPARRRHPLTGIGQ